MRSLTDVTIINNLKFEILTEVLDLGNSDHLAQIPYIKANNIKTGLVIKKKIHFTNKSIEFKYLLHKESLEDIHSSDDVNSSFNTLMIKFMYYFNRAFPLKTTYVKDKFENKWIYIYIYINTFQKFRLLPSTIEYETSH
jgi:hypothetical protein